VTEAPTQQGRRGLAAAGGDPPRRPQALRQLPVIMTLACALAACGAGQSSASQDVFRVTGQVSLSQLDRAMSVLYQTHPAIGSYVVQDVQYTPRSRTTALRNCTSPSGSAGSATAQAQTAESAQLIACAPLIFFLYRYGHDASVPDATAAAGELYSYAVTHISGPADAKASLDELLRSWGIPAPPITSAEARTALRNAVFAAAYESMLGQKSVHLAITGYKPGSTGVAETITADIGRTTGVEQIASGAATAEIRVTASGAYFSGNAAGLTKLLGLSAQAASRAGSSWVETAAGSNEYQNLAAEDTLPSLPASILPARESAAELSTTTMDGRKVYVLRWSTPATTSSPAISVQLTLDATAHALPITETTVANGFRQTVTLSRWGETLAVPAPPSAVPYASLTG